MHREASQFFLLKVEGFQNRSGKILLVRNLALSLLLLLLLPGTAWAKDGQCCGTQNCCCSAPVTSTCCAGPVTPLPPTGVAPSAAAASFEAIARSVLQFSSPKASAAGAPVSWLEPATRSPGNWLSPLRLSLPPPAA